MSCVIHDTTTRWHNTTFLSPSQNGWRGITFTRCICGLIIYRTRLLCRFEFFVKGWHRDWGGREARQLIRVLQLPGWLNDTGVRERRTSKRYAAPFYHGNKIDSVSTDTFQIWFPGLFRRVFCCYWTGNIGGVGDWTIAIMTRWHI